MVMTIDALASEQTTRLRVTVPVQTEQLLRDLATRDGLEPREVITRALTHYAQSGAGQQAATISPRDLHGQAQTRQTDCPLCGSRQCQHGQPDPWPWPAKTQPIVSPPAKTGTGG